MDRSSHNLDSVTPMAAMVQARVTATVPCLEGILEKGECRKGNPSSSHIVVEDRMIVSVPLEKLVCIHRTKVFEVQQTMREVFPDEVNESEGQRESALFLKDGA